MNIQIGNPDSLYLIGFVVGGVALMIWTLAVRNRSLSKFASSRFRQTLLPRRSLFWSGMSAVLVTASLLCLVLALLDIRWGKTNREVPQKGIEVMFALDVSRSMLAEDASPNRLARAKQQIEDMVDEMAGDRVGLVVFAGETKQAVPLTSHYDDFKQVLESVGPHTLRLGGSRLGDAIESAAKGFMDKTNEHRTIVLFTDGEDHESDPTVIAKKLHEEQGIRIFTVGLGDMDQGSRIPDNQMKADAFLQHEGQQVWSKMNGQVLNAIATESEGAYIPAGTKQVNMADVYHNYVANIEQTEFETATINAWVPRYQWFAAAALLFLCLEILVSTRRNQQNERAAKKSGTSVGNRDSSGDEKRRSSQARPRAKVAAAAMFLALWTALPAQAQSPNDVAREINAASQLLEQDAAQAINALSAIEADLEQRDLLNYNLAVAHYRNGDLAAAKTLFQQSARADDVSIAANSRYNLGNCQYAEGLSQAESDGEAAKQQLSAAIDSFRDSLRLDRDNADARVNIELANKLLEELKEKEQDESQQDESQQDESQQDESQQDQSQQDESQQDQSQQDESQQDESQQDESQQDQSQQDQSQQDESQQDQSQQDESQQDQSQQASDEQQPSEQDSSDQNAASQDAQQQNQPLESGEENDEAMEPGEEAESDSEEVKETPAGQLSAANEAAEEDSEKPSTAAAIESNDDEGRMSREEALKMLQSVRDRDMLRRLRQQQRERSRRRPVDRDW